MTKKIERKEKVDEGSSDPTEVKHSNFFYSEIYLHFVFKVIESSSAVPGWRKDLILEEEVKIPIVCNTFPSTASSPPGPPPHGWTGNYGGSSKCVILLLSSTDKAKLLHGSRDLHLPKALLRHGTHRSPPPPSPWRSSNQLSIICQAEVRRWEEEKASRGLRPAAAIKERAE